MISTIFIGLIIIYCLYLVPSFNLLFNVFSDFGWYDKTANIFNFGLIFKGFLDCIFVWHANRELKIKDWRVKLFLYLPMVTFMFIGFFPKFPLRPIHWTFVFISFVTWILSQYIYAKYSKNETFMGQTRFLIIVEIIFLVFLFSNRLFWGIAELFIMTLFVTWLWRFQKILFKH